tara:strand:- start:266 stop:430 length:165 start_codon:yes stop_codon:yes gene_type:complete
VEVGRHDGFSSIQYSTAIDDVVAPGQTRDRIAKVLRHLKRRVEREEKKHPLDSW